MDTKTNTTKSAEQRFADTYREASHGEQQTAAPKARSAQTPEERMAAAYRTAEPAPQKPSSTASTQRPPLTAEEKLAATYGQPEEAQADENADDADQEGREQTEHEAEPLRAPEGYQPLDTETAGGLASIAKELGLPDGAMQQLVDKVSPLLQARTNRNLQRMMDTWVEETTNDPEIGGEKLDGSVKLARSALDRFGSPELRKLIGPISKGGTGLGNNREFMRFLVRIGRETA